MPQPPQENLRWAALQLLENCRRAGVTLVRRGTSRFAESWETADSSLPSPEKEPLYAAPLPTDSPMASSLAQPLAENEKSLSLRPSDGLPENVRPSPSRSLPAFPSELGASDWQTPPLSLKDRSARFAVLRQEVAACRRCDELACSRKQTVFGVGNLMPRVAFFGEAPGADEDRVGEPFVGAAGQLLNRIIAASRMTREEVYILNSLRCRPPQNRTPFDHEIENCRPFFEAQLETLQPEFIVCLGAAAVRAVLRTTDSIGRLRGRFHRYRRAQVLVTYHPAYLLRNSDAKKLVWDDMKMLMRAMGLMSTEKDGTENR